MEILIRHSEKYQRICILGNIQSDSELQKLSAAIDDISINQQLQIDFYDADHLSADVLNMLRHCADTRPAFKIVAYHHLLGQRLLRLNLPVHQIVVEQGK